MIKKGTRVNIYGREYSIKGDASDEYIRELAGYVDAKMREVAGNGSAMDAAKLAILAAVNIAHELHRLKKEQKEQDMAIYKKTEDIIDTIEEQFEDIKFVE
ncbi:MAG: cell division protein ZapA [Nitrospirae bacterium]|nr:cell division protein ZapA [Nitrospirota bacterium]